MTGRWNRLEHLLEDVSSSDSNNFDLGIGMALHSLLHQQFDSFAATIESLRSYTVRSITTGTVMSLQACHETMLKFQILTELEEIAGIPWNRDQDPAALVDILNRRLGVVGAFGSDKRYLLGLRRAAMQVSRYFFPPYSTVSN